MLRLLKCYIIYQDAKLFFRLWCMLMREMRRDDGQATKRVPQTSP
jgi:hypothetical protein